MFISIYYYIKNKPFGILIQLKFFEWFKKIKRYFIKYISWEVNSSIDDNETINNNEEEIVNKKTLRRTQSQQFKDSLNELYIWNNTIRSSNFNCQNYSITFMCLSKIIPPHSKSMEHLNELVKNRTYNIRLCCNPECKNQIVGYCFCAFDGYYCSVKCRNLASHYISDYWDKV